MRGRAKWGIGAALLLVCALCALCAGWSLRRPPIPEAEALAAPRREPRPTASARSRPQSGWREVRCEVPLAREGDEIVAMAVGTREATQTALVEGGGFVLVLPPGALTLLVDVPGIETVRVEVDEGGGCALANQPRPQIALTLSVRLPSGKPPMNVAIRGCGHNWKVLVPSDPVVQVTAPEPCEIEAWGDDGSVVQVSDPVPVDPKRGDQDIAIVLPWERPAGLMLQVEKNSEGFEVTQVRSLAADVLSVGDQIVAIEGEDAEGLTVSDFIRLDAGPPETFATLIVRDDDGTEREVRVPREG